jgi:hypothetical protein
VVVVFFFFFERKKEEDEKKKMVCFLSPPLTPLPSLLKHASRLAEPVGPLHLLPSRVVEVAVEEQAVVGRA